MGGVGRLVMFTSEDAHYSVKKMAGLEGLGTDNVISVRTDDRGKMETGHLVQLITQHIALGHKPFLVSATAGTTLLLNS
jgi:glutamate decarboxylase